MQKCETIVNESCDSDLFKLISGGNLLQIQALWTRTMENLISKSFQEEWPFKRIPTTSEWL